MQKFELSPKPFLDQVEGKFYLEHLKSGKPVLSIWANFEIESCLDSTYIETEIKYDFPLESISIQSLIVFNLGSMKSDESAFQWESFDMTSVLSVSPRPELWRARQFLIKTNCVHVIICRELHSQQRSH